MSHFQNSKPDQGKKEKKSIVVNKTTTTTNRLTAYKRKGDDFYTETMPSLADKTNISEQETTPGHSLSTASLIVSRYLKFLNPKLLSVSFSERDLLVESSRSEASHDYKNQNQPKPIVKM